MVWPLDRVMTKYVIYSDGLRHLLLELVDESQALPSVADELHGIAPTRLRIRVA